MKRGFICLVSVALIAASCSQPEKIRLRVLHAGSLSIPFQAMAAAFMRENPQVDVELEAHGSRTAARQISDLNRRADVMGSADSAVIRTLLIPDHADWCIDFSTNEMVIMYSEKSRYHREITQENWYRILLREDVQYGHSDPNSDPCGYRTLLAWKLAELHYSSMEPQAENLSEKLRSSMPARNMRPKEVDLIAMLEAGELDYIFIYRSVAEQHHAPHLRLPDAVNLKSPEFAERYALASVRITGKKPGEWILKHGAPMVYGITLPRNAAHPEWGAKFIAFVLGDEGRRIMAENGQPEIIPPRVDHPDLLPKELQPIFLSVTKGANGG